MKVGGPDADLAQRRKLRGRVAQQSVLFYRVAYVLLTPFWRFWTGGFRILGTENVPTSGGGFIIANHTTGFDPAIIAYAIRHRLLCGPGKLELFRHPFGAYVMRLIGVFPLRRGEADATGVRAMIELYRSGRWVVVYPEGTRSETGELLPFLPEFARLAIKLKVPLVPVAVAGGERLLPRGARFPRRHAPLALAAGPPFDLVCFAGRPLTPELLQEATELMHGRVREQLERARAVHAEMI